MRKLLVLAWIAGIISSCSSLKVTNDYDSSADFASFQTYNYTEQALSLDINNLAEQRLFGALDGELAAKGLRKADNPDLLIDINFKLDQKQTATATTTGADFYGRGYRYRWGPTFSTTTINYNEYTEGTLFLDFISTAQNQLVWQGRGVGTIREDGTPEQRNLRTQKAIAKILSKYPPKQ
ncbi:MAG: DUF4136 domain-containing protein [Bacteroidota bacterium]